MRSLLFALTVTLSITGVVRLKREGKLTTLSKHKYMLFETHRAPVTFEKLDVRPGTDHRITLHIGLKHTRLENSIHDLVERMSDPFHPNFRPHLTDDELVELSRPDEQSIKVVSSWLQDHGFRENHVKWTAPKDWIILEKVPLNKIEEMLNTTYSVYRHQDGDHIIRTEKYSLPQSLHDHIDLIQPTTTFGFLHKKKSTGKKFKTTEVVNKKTLLKIPDICIAPIIVTNGCLRQLYKTEGYNVQVPEKNAIATTGFLGEAANFEDAKLFLKTQRSDQVGGTFEVISVNGGSNPQELSPDQISKQIGLEANLDTQTALGLTLPTRNIFFTVGGGYAGIVSSGKESVTNEPYLEWLTYMLHQPIDKIPRVISSSYGDDEQSVPISYARRVCNGFAALAARGVSVLSASGDYGVGQGGTCYTNDGREKPTFLPLFPASCPYVTAVGGTEYLFPEVAINNSGPSGFSSGGGFSNYFATPKWQQSAVDRYLQWLGPDKYKGLYNSTGRAYPDVSAQGVRYAIALRQEFMSISGTSASTPTFASIIALLNDYSLSLGGPALGFLNPWLYSSAYQGLNDILSGSADGCNMTGFSALPGWDPVTGLGTPDFVRLQSLIEPWSVAMIQSTKDYHARKKTLNINSSTH